MSSMYQRLLARFLWLMGHTGIYSPKFMYCSPFQSTCVGYKSNTRIIEVRIIEDVLYLGSKKENILRICLCTTSATKAGRRRDLKVDFITRYNADNIKTLSKETDKRSFLYVGYLNA